MITLEMNCYVIVLYTDISTFWIILMYILHFLFIIRISRGNDVILQYLIHIRNKETKY